MSMSGMMVMFRTPAPGRWRKRGILRCMHELHETLLQKRERKEEAKRDGDVI